MYDCFGNISKRAKKKKKKKLSRMNNLVDFKFY